MRRTRRVWGVRALKVAYRLGAALVALIAGASSARAEEVAAAITPMSTSANATPSTVEATHNFFETGILLGALFPPHGDTALKDPTRGQAGRYDGVGLEFGLRLAYLPIPYLGIEGEGAVIPTQTAIKGVKDDWATLFTVRGHVILQVPTPHLTPFILGGLGRLWVRGDDVLGKDGDLTWHFGGGLKLPLSKHSLLRVDVRDVVVPGQGGSTRFAVNTTHWPEATLGFSIACGGTEPPPPPPAPVDSDHDGLTDDVDKCPVAPAQTPDGCPIPDTDGDGVLDNADACPMEKGTLPNGCPDLDPDHDNIPVPTDACPEQAGIAPDGCPDRDVDRDGVPIPDDKCPDAAETRNGFEDTDGCPDEVPEVVRKFTGVIQGINFDLGKSTIRKNSFALLDQAAKVLLDYPALRLEISGHTDNVGKAARNLSLSQARAESVRAYLMGRGIGAERLEARGAGSNEPIADNKTRTGQAKNRRIEFKIVQ